jgi:Rap1a immunity proteins
MRFRLLLLVATLSACSSARALTKVTGLTLLHDCRVTVRSIDDPARLTESEQSASDSCISYIQGLMDANEFWHGVDRLNHSATKHYCIERDTSLEQVIRILVKYLEETPKELNENGWVCLQAALLKDFPCKG